MSSSLVRSSLKELLPSVISWHSQATSRQVRSMAHLDSRCQQESEAGASGERVTREDLPRSPLPEAPASLSVIIAAGGVGEHAVAVAGLGPDRLPPARGLRAGERAKRGPGSVGGQAG